MKYVIVTINGIHVQIAETTNIKGYTIGILESFIPTDEEMKDWDEKKAKE